MPGDMTFIMAGQSNMAGWTESKFHELPGWLKVKPSQVRFYQYGQLSDFSRQRNGSIFRMAGSRIQNSLYALLKRQVEISKVLENNNRVTGFIWMQGERDARFPQSANAYAGNLRTLIFDMRREYQSPNAPFILGRVNPPVAQFPAVETIRRTQVQIARQIPNTRWVNTDDLHKAADRIHYNTRGQIYLGRRMAEAFRRVYRG